MLHSPPTKDEISLYVDMPTALSRVRNNKKLYKRMLGLFVESEEFLKFEQALAQKDIPLLADISHGIKGMTGNLALTKLFEISTTLMAELRAGTLNDASIDTYHDTLADTITCVKVTLETLEV